MIELVVDPFAQRVQPLVGFLAQPAADERDTPSSSDCAPSPALSSPLRRPWPTPSMSLLAAPPTAPPTVSNSPDRNPDALSPAWSSLLPMPLPTPSISPLTLSPRIGSVLPILSMGFEALLGSVLLASGPGSPR